MRSKKAALLINPRTGENVAKLAGILPIFAAAGWKTDLALKEYGKHVMQLASEATGKSDVVIAYGGDGTLNQVVNGVMSAKGAHSAVAVVPGGTANVWAGEIGVPGDAVKAALALVNSEDRKVDVGRVQVVSVTFPGEEPVVVGKKARKKVTSDSVKVRHHFLLMAGLGIDAAVMNNVSKPLKYRVGPLAVGISAMKEMPVQHSFLIEIQTVGAKADDAPLWKGEAMQVVVGNTRRYAKVAEMTPDAYIDDGKMDVCVITAGTPLSNVQQLASLLFRKKPDTTSTEYFQGAHLLLKVPASVPFQVDGSPVKLKDYLSKADYTKLQQVEHPEQVTVTYQIDTLPRALDVVIPRTYNEELFEQTPAGKRHEEKGESFVQLEHHAHDTFAETATQQHTVAVETKPESDVNGTGESKAAEPQVADAVRKEDLPGFIDELLKNGRHVTIVGKAPNPAQKQTYIIAGSLVKDPTAEVVPVAVVVNAATELFNHQGQKVPDIGAIAELQEGGMLVVEGGMNKRNVIHATRLLI